MINPRYALRDTSELLSPGLLIYSGLVRRNLEDMIAMARGGAPAASCQDAQDGRDRQAGGIAGDPQAQVCDHRRGGDGRRGRRDRRAPGLSADGPEPEAFRAAGTRLSPHHVPGDGGSPRFGEGLSTAVEGLERPVPVLLDLEIGMGRTGIEPGEPAAELYALVDRLPNLVADGLHAYDGQVHDSDREERKSAQDGIERTLALRDRIIKRGLDVPRMVLGGTPTFPIYAELELPGVECSPGTPVLYDAGYSARYPDLNFTPAALILTRVVSHPRPGRLCLDLGYKAVAADPTGPRVSILELEDVQIVGHSEEHLVIDTPAADSVPIGTPLLAVPTHICPTVALHRRAYVIEDGQVVGQWEVTARDRTLGV